MLNPMAIHIFRRMMKNCTQGYAKTRNDERSVTRGLLLKSRRVHFV